MDCGTLILVATVLGGVAVGWALISRLVRSHRAVQARPGELRALATKLGLTFSERDPEEDEPLLRHTVYGATFSGPSNRLSGVVDGLQVDVLDSAWHTGGRTGHYRTQLVVVFSANAPRWPRFVLQDWAASEPGLVDDSLKDVAEVELGLEPLEESYTVAARAADEVRPLFTPALTAALVELAQAGRALTVESCGDRLVLWREKDTIPLVEVEQLLADARRIRALLDDAAASTPGGRPASGAVQGANLDAGGATCGRCGAARAAGARFCPACGGQYA